MTVRWIQKLCYATVGALLAEQRANGSLAPQRGRVKVAKGQIWNTRILLWKQYCTSIGTSIQAAHMSVKTFRERLKIEVIREPLLTSSCIMSVFILIESSGLILQGFCLHLLGLKCFVRHYIVFVNITWMSGFVFRCEHYLNVGDCLESRGCHISRGHTKVTSSPQQKETNKTRHTKFAQDISSKGV